MKHLSESVESLRANLERLLRLHNALKNENDILKNQIDAQRRGIGEKNKQIEALEHQMDLLKASQAVASNMDDDAPDPERREIRSRINDLIKEVDRAIARLQD
ncbi:MAG: hypothetical protein R2794_08600 [Chitinophagales bacterium]